MTRAKIALLAILLSLGAVGGAQAEERNTRFYFRAGVVRIIPLEVADELALDDVEGPASLAVSDGPIAGSGAQVDSSTIPGVIIGYVTPWWNGRLSFEAVLGPPFEIEFRATGTLADESLAPEALGIPTGVPALGTEIGKTKAAPPTVTAVYRFAKMLGPVQPYAGTGLALLLAFDSKVTNRLLTEAGDPDFSVAPAPGLVLQGGLETRLWKSVWATLDIKFIAFMLARARVENIVMRAPGLPLFEEVEVGQAKMNVWINPLVIQLGVGMDF